MDADPGLLGELRELRGRSVEQVAEICQVDRSTVERWESGDTKPYPRNRRALAAALGVPLGPLVRAVWGRTQQERQMHRRHLLRIVMGLPALALPNLADQPDFDLHETTVRLVGRYPTAAPADLLTDARIHLDTLTAAMDRPLRPGRRRLLLVDAVDTAALAADAAKHDGHPGEAAAYRALARSLADESGIGRLRGCALLLAALAHAPVWGDGDSLAALELLNAAAPLIGSRGLVPAAVAMYQAEHCAALGREREALAAIARAEAAGVDDDGEGFFSAAAWLADAGDPRKMAGWQGFCQLLSKSTDDGLVLAGHALDALPVNASYPARCHSNISLGHTLACVAPDLKTQIELVISPHFAGFPACEEGCGEPEPACQAAEQTLAISEATGYREGIQRIHIVRGRMPEEWADMACVRALDERLGLAA
ncbi:MAG: helix-turn-helix domain-containing protein [Egibacteraceae bacterium]